MISDKKNTDFGFQEVPYTEKVKRVGAVFSSVASRYDLMNDLMSLGLHRIWKRLTVFFAQVKPGSTVLDLAGGTGDLAVLFSKKVGAEGRVILTDINADMLTLGRDKVIDRGCYANTAFLQANAECLPLEENRFDVVSIAFGLRNVTDKNAALAEMYRVLKPGGQVFILEFSKVQSNTLQKIYDFYSFKVLPRLGAYIANDADSYRYLAESIRRHPNQQKLLACMEKIGFAQCQIHNFLGGIVALHRGYKF